MLLGRVVVYRTPGAKTLASSYNIITGNVLEFSKKEDMREEEEIARAAYTCCRTRESGVTTWTGRRSFLKGSVAFLPKGFLPKSLFGTASFHVLQLCSTNHTCQALSIPHNSALGKGGVHPNSTI
jgi:hypothetical protein